MFELNIAAKYLLPRWKRLSLSLISMIAILVISLVVWLILVFFSVTNGLEKMWIEKLIILTGPARILPTEAYYKSYYYLIDTISHSSDYQPKSIEEKLLANTTHPWDENIDEEVPPLWPRPLLQLDGSHKDLVKELFAAIQEEKELDSFIYEVAPATLKLNLDRRAPQEEGRKLYTPLEGQIQQNGLILSFDPHNGSFKKNLLPLRQQDIDNLFKVATDSPSLLKELNQTLPPTLLKTPSYGWILPKSLYPSSGSLVGIPLYFNQQLRAILIPSTPPKHPDILEIVFKSDKTPLVKNFPLYHSSVPLVLEPNFPIIPHKHDLLTEVELTLQGHTLRGPVSLLDLDISAVDIQGSPPWIHSENDQFFNLPTHPILGDGILLPKSFQDAGVLVGDRGHLAFEAPSLGSLQQVHLPVYVAGFYDPGLMGMGGKFIFSSPDVSSLIRSSLPTDSFNESNGIQLRYPDYKKIHQIKSNLQKRLEERQLSPYFHLETYEEYEFAKGFIQELKSQRNLFLILAGIIIVVACSNIISMLIILVNDKKKEIGILRALGARTLSIGAIFGLIGLLMGLIGSLIGLLLSLVTLQYLPSLISLLSQLQGFDAFQRLFYNNTFPQHISPEALQFVLVSTTLTSILAAIIPAVKACTVKPAAMLRSE